MALNQKWITPSSMRIKMTVIGTPSSQSKIGIAFPPRRETVHLGLGCMFCSSAESVSAHLTSPQRRQLVVLDGRLAIHDKRSAFLRIILHGDNFRAQRVVEEVSGWAPRSRHLDPRGGPGFSS
jgi:hypothetical protein